MLQDSKILDEGRFVSRVRFGDTVTTLGLKFLTALDQKSQTIWLAFRSFGETFGQVLRRYLIAAQPQHATKAQYAIEFLQTHELVSEGKRLEAYKGEIEQGKAHFRIYPLETYQMVQIASELRSLIKESTILNPSLLVPENDITVVVQKPNSQVLEVTVNRFSPLKVLKLEICKREGLQFGEFSLIYVGKMLDSDDDTLEECGIQDRAMVMLAMMVKLGCFAPHSRIAIAGGDTRRADELVRGDGVISLREGTWEAEKDEVVAVHKTMLSCYLVILLADGTEIECTPNHKFLSEGKWRSFSSKEGGDRLRVGECISRGDLSPVRIVSIRRVKTERPVEFIHISTLHNHNFLLNGLPSHNMEVRLLNTADGHEFSINISESDTIEMVKLRAEAVLGVSKEQLMIVLNKHELRNHESISDYIQDIKNCNCLEVVQVAQQTIVVTRLKTKKELRFKLDKEQLVKQLKKEIERQADIPRDLQILILNNVEMLNGQRIGEFELHKNFNRINMVEVEEEVLSLSKMIHFELKKMIYVRIQGNDYLRLNYFSLKEMRVQQFLASFLPDSRPSYSLLVGQHLLRPTDLLKSIEPLPVFNSEEINCYVLRSYDRLAFYPALAKDQKLLLSSAGVDATTMAGLKAREPEINKQLSKSEYFHTLKGKFGEQLADFYLPIQAYVCHQSAPILATYLERFVGSEEGQIAHLPGHSFCSTLTRSLLAVPAYVGETHRLLPGVRFREIYEKRGETFCLQSFLSTNAKLSSLPPPPLRNYTILHLQSLTGRPIGAVSAVKDEVVFLPFSYFYINRVAIGENFDQAWAVEVPTPLSFDRDLFMWVDDEPNSPENRAICDLLDHSRFELVQLTATEVAEYWMREFGWILRWLGKRIKVMSDMKRAEGAGGAMVNQAGIDLVESFHNDFGYTAPIFIYCQNIHAARKAMQARNIVPGRIQKITNDQFELLKFLASE